MQANTNPSEAQQSKQVGSGKEPPQVEHTQTEETIEDEGGATSVRKTQQTRIETEGGASVTLRRGVEEGMNSMNHCSSLCVKKIRSDL